MGEMGQYGNAKIGSMRIESGLRSRKSEKWYKSADFDKTMEKHRKPKD